MRRFSYVAFVGLIALGSAFASLLHGQTQESPVDKVKWQKGPSVGSLGEIAEVNVPEGYVFANAADTKILMEAMQNPVSGKELGFVAPAKLDWFVVFEFDDVGYVRGLSGSFVNSHLGHADTRCSRTEPCLKLPTW